MTGIYLITNKLSGKKYVGQALDIEKRWKRHICDSKKSEYHIHRALRKYGIENFSFEVLEECPVDKLDEREIYWINELDAYNNGYNMTLGGEGNNQGKDSYSKEYKKETNRKYIEQHKEEIKQSSKKRYQIHKEERRQYREEHKEERRQYMAQYNQKRKEYYKKYREAHREEISIKQRERRAKSMKIHIDIEIPLW